jgi:uncharacterized protein (TIGR02453 family)
VFPGFPPEALTFLRNLRRNNNREWFQPRKQIFETQLKEPMLALCDALNGEFAKFGPDYINDPKKALFRIYRDTRFSSDKTPYKTHIAAIFRRRGEKRSSPAFYCSLSLEGVGVAGGLYEPEPEHLPAIRSWLAENHREFRTAARRPEKLMGALKGEALQRIPKGFEAAHPATPHPAADLIKMKQWYYYTTLDLKLATSPKVLAEIVKRFRIMMPVAEMLNQPLARSKQASARSAGMFGL